MSVRDTYIQFAVDDGAGAVDADRSPDTVPAPPQGFIPRRQRNRQSAPGG